MANKAYQRIYTKLEAITKATVSLKAKGVSNDELAVVGGKLAQVVKTKGDLVTLQVFSGTEGIPTNAEVTFLGEPPILKVSDQLSGRFFNAYGEPLEGDRRSWWQAQIAHVPQHIFLSDTTIARNIAFGVATDAIDRARLEDAARSAGIHDFIASLPNVRFQCLLFLPRGQQQHCQHTLPDGGPGDRVGGRGPLACGQRADRHHQPAHPSPPLLFLYQHNAPP